MTRSSWLLLAVLAACGGHEDPGAPTEPAAPPLPKVDPIVKGIPHGGQIAEVAVTEQGDAALTFDTVGGVRLWPALDGSRTPIPLAAVAPKKLALSHAGRDLLAAVLDQAGTVDLLRLGLDGSVRGRVQLPAEVAYEQVLALDDGVLVRSADQSIEWLSADGESRGKLVAEPSRRVQAIAVRRGVAVAITTEGTKHQLRWLLMMGGKLTWGAGVDLPMAIKGDDIALSPSHRRIAIVDSTSNVGVYEIGLVPTRVGNTVVANGDIDLGFIDDDHVVVMSNSMLQWWTMPQKPAASKDPWAVPSTPNMPTLAPSHVGNGGAAADGVAVTGFGASLALVDRDRARYLGYKEHGVGNLGAAPSSLWVSMTGSHVVWLDNKLAIKRDVELRSDPNGPWLYATPIGERHVVTQAPVDGKYLVRLVDLDRPEQPITLGTYPSVERVELTHLSPLEPASGLLGVSVYNKVHRFKIDLATNIVTPLAPLRTSGSLMSLRLLDPARADGITAITVGWDGDYDDLPTLTMYRERGKKQKLKQFKGTLIDIDASGTVYLHDGNEIQIRRGEKKLASFAAKGIGAPMAVNSDGSRFAMREGNDIVVLDGQGAEKWRKPLWGAAQLVFTKDGKQLAVRATGGLVLLTAETGEREALECGWSFELMTTAPTMNALAVASVCEDPMLQ